MGQSVQRMSCMDMGRTATLPYLLPTRVSPVNLAFPLHRHAAQQKKVLKQLKPVPCTGGYGGTAATKIASCSGGLSGRSTVRTCTQDRLPARHRRAVLSRYRLLAQTGSCLDLARSLASHSPLVRSRFHSHICLCAVNSLNAWPVSCLACRPPALAYISRLSRPESRPPQDRSAVASCSFLFLFLFVIVNRERDQRVWQWLCFLDILPRPLVYIAPPGASPDGIYPSCWQE
jgi:hypothetical protein